MSAFNPLPDQLQQDSGSPAVDVMAPPDQQPAAAAQPAPTPNYPPSPDQGGPVPQSSDPDAGSNVHGWRAVLRGALSGLENHLKGAGEGLITGGIPGAVAGAVSPGLADRAMQYRQQTMQAELQQKQANVQATKAITGDHEAQMAFFHVNLLEAQRAYDLAPKSVQEMIDQQEEKFAGQLQTEGFSPVQSGIESMADAQNIALARNQTDTSNSAFGYVPLRTADGSWAIFHVSTPGQPLQRDAELPLLKADGTLTSIPVKAGSMSVGQFAQLFSSRVVDIGKQQSAAAAKIEISNATNASDKNAAIAQKDRAAAAGNAPSTPTTDSLGVTITPRRRREGHDEATGPVQERRRRPGED